MLRHLREEAQPLAIDREVACFLAAGRKPIAIKVERGGLQIVGVADDAQHRAASARDLAGFDLLAVRLDRLVGPDTKVHAIIGRRSRTPLGTPDIEGRTCLRMRPAALRHTMNRWMVAPSVPGSPRCSMIATGVGGTSRTVTSSVVKVFCMSLFLALSRGPKAASHGSQSGELSGTTKAIARTVAERRGRRRPVHGRRRPSLCL